ncbi:MAG: hypothetical protein RMM17_00815 [Acidobacteriota bacterium]|nr:hypothetical protein [Blastocatellia bacterium]MDW8411209.1 hypothetical protein [Acidobacteriota bacterium]
MVRYTHTTQEERELIEQAFGRSRGGLDLLLCRNILERILTSLGRRQEIDWIEDDKLISLALRVLSAVNKGVVREQHIRNAYESFALRMHHCVDPVEKTELMLEMLLEIDGSNARLREYRSAIRTRWLDISLVIERYKLALEQEAKFQEKGLNVLTHLVTDFLEQLSSPTTRYKVVRTLLVSHNLENILNDRIENGHGWFVRASALSFYNSIIEHIDADSRRNLFSSQTVRLVTRVAYDGQEEVWTRKEAMQLLVNTYPEDALEIFESYLRHPKLNDELFLRAAIVRLLGKHFVNEAGLQLIEQILRNDPSEHVQIEALKALALFPATTAITRLSAYIGTKSHACEQVRAAALESLSKLTIDEAYTRQVVDSLHRAISSDDSLLVRRTALEELVAIAMRRPAVAQIVLEHIQSYIESPHEKVFFRRLAWNAYEAVYLSLQPEKPILDEIIEKLANLYEGERLLLRFEELRSCSVEQLARALALRAADDFGYFIEPKPDGYLVQRGERWGKSLWRLLHEARHPAPDKRKGASHTVGRKPFGQIRIPSQILAELTKTRVPGEPLFIELEGGWRPFVPLLTDCLDALLRTTPVRIFTTLGITTISSSLRPLERTKAYLKLCWNFEKVADLRNVGLDGRNPEGPVEYIETLRSYGIDCTYQPYATTANPPQDPSLEKLFSISSKKLAETSQFVAMIPSLDLLFEQFKAYLTDHSANNLSQLWVFFTIILLIFLLRQIVTFYNIRRALNKIPLIIGGWGTRGKSGTERKKAALFHALGYNVFCKTTGCEAMFLHTAAEQKATEIFLYRPYDKASIWEMGTTAQLAAELKAEVYLWECMALNPRFVRLLQRGWMNDYLATLTNTYPDHEDVQGPAGIDIPRVMTEFIPIGKTVITSEDQMLPILRDAARKYNSKLYEVPWRASAMFTKDILDRFPYKVHPRNLALVLTLAERFQIDRDFALKEIADHIVPDLGVLKTYPKVVVENRTLEFSNAMSANERRGFNDSWRRAGHAGHTDERDPGTWIVTVVNNRADRIPRSQVFAEVVVRDAFAHKHVLIGTNLNGLMGYIRKSLDNYLPTIDLYASAAEAPSAERIQAAHKALEERLAELKAEAVSVDAVATKTALMLANNQLASTLKEALNNNLDAEAIVNSALETTNLSEKQRQSALEHFRTWTKRLGSIQQIRQMINSALNKEAELQVNEFFRAFFKEVFLSKLLVVEDAHATGDEIILKIAEASPPNYLLRIIGMQNIKGTGLDFVYRWVALERVKEMGRQLLDPSEKKRSQAADFFIYFDEYGLVTRPAAIEAIKTALASPINQIFSMQQKLKAALQAAEATTQASNKASQNNFVDRMLDKLEILLESQDSKRRRKQADLVLRELTRQTISHERAAAILRELTVRQKGGWLKKQLRSKEKES